MFVRWKKRVKERGGYALSAYLVQSVRVQGKPRQKVIAHLCTVESSDGVTAAPKVKEAGGWWCGIEDALQKLSLDEQTKTRIFAAVEQKAPRPGQKEITEAKGLRDYFDKWGEEYNRTKVPNTPPLLVSDSTLLETSTALYIKWTVEQPNPKFGKVTKYRAFLAREKNIIRLNKEEIQSEMLGGYYTNYKGETAVSSSWMRFWYAVHCSLCIAFLDPAEYHKVLELLYQWVRRPTSEEWSRIIQDGIRGEELDVRHERRNLNRITEKIQRREEELFRVVQVGKRYLV